MIADRLAGLRTRFVERSMADREAILRAIAAESPDRALIGGLAHRLAGGGGTVGLSAISAAAAALEDACDAGEADAIRTAALALCALIASTAVAAAPRSPNGRDLRVTPPAPGGSDGDA